MFSKILFYFFLFIKHHYICKVYSKTFSWKFLFYQSNIRNGLQTWKYMEDASMYQESDKWVRPKQIASLQPLQTPEAITTVLSSTRQMILNNSSIGISFHSVITPPLCIFPNSLPNITSFLKLKFNSSLVKSPTIFKIKYKNLKLNTWNQVTSVSN